MRGEVEWRGDVCPSLAKGFDLSFLFGFFREKHAPIIWKNTEMFQFAAQKEIVRKKHLFTLPPPTLGVYLRILIHKETQMK